MLRLGPAVLAAVVSAASPAYAQDWPAARTIKFIVPFPPGGSTDLVARLMADLIGKPLGQSIVVENQAGAGGNIGIAAAAKSTPDGYTVLIAPDSISSSAHVFKISYDPLKDLVPVVQLTRQPVVLAVNASLGVTTVADLVKIAKQRDDLSYVTSGVGSQQHIVGEWFVKLAGIKLVHVAYRGGGQAINDLVAGHVKVGSLGSAPVLPHHTAGTLRIIAQTTRARSIGLGDVPTYIEAGYPDIVLDQWLGIFLPTGTPSVIAARLNAEANKALSDTNVRAKLAQSALEPVGGTHQQFGKLVAEDFERYAKLVKDLGIKAVQ